MRKTSFAGLLVAVLLFAGLSQAQNVEVINKGKRATALVVVREGSIRVWGSAFCVSSAGFFITNAHVIPKPGMQATVVRDSRGGVNRVVVPGRGAIVVPRARLTHITPLGRSVELVLNPGEADQKAYPARIVDMNRLGDLAVLQIAADQPLPTLDSGDASGLIETMPVTAFGYPFGQLLAEKGDDYPNITVSTGRITSLRKSHGELEAIQLDAALNPGNSGGPLLNENGKVVGIVERGIPGASVNFAMPVARLTDLLKSPLATLEANRITVDHVSEETEFTIRILSPLAVDMQQATVSLELGPRGTSARTFEATRIREQVYRLKASPLPAAASDGVAGTPAVPVPPSFSIVIKRPGTDEVRVAGQLSFDVAGVPDQPAQWVATDPQTAGEAAPTVAAIAATNPNVSQPAPVIGTPMELDGYKVVELPGQPEALVSGYAGRILVLWFPSTRQMGFFDAASQQITYVKIDSDNALVAATSNDLLVVERDRGMIERWNLHTHQRELVQPLAGAASVSAVAAGESGNGPLIVARKADVQFVDVWSLKPQTINVPSLPAEWKAAKVVQASASADGHSFLLSATDPQPQRLRLLSLDGTVVHQKLATMDLGSAKPSADGRTIIGSLHLLDSNLQLIQASDIQNTFFQPVPGMPYMTGYRAPASGQMPKFSLYVAEDFSRLGDLPDLPELFNAGGELASRPSLGVFDRIHVIPGSGIVVALDQAERTLLIRDFHLGQVMAHAGSRQLFVTSMAPRSVPPGGTLDYRMRVESGKGGLRFTLNQGPPGMTVSPDGIVSWTAPSSPLPDPVVVGISIKDRLGQEIHHNFQLWVQ